MILTTRPLEDQAPSVSVISSSNTSILLIGVGKDFDFNSHQFPQHEKSAKQSVHVEPARTSAPSGYEHAQQLQSGMPFKQCLRLGKSHGVQAAQLTKHATPPGMISRLSRCFVHQAVSVADQVLRLGTHPLRARLEHDPSLRTLLARTTTLRSFDKTLPNHMRSLRI